MMTNNRNLVLLLMVLLSGCMTPKYLPDVDTIDVNPNGSYIKVNTNPNGGVISGEFIALDSVGIWLLEESSNQLTRISYGEFHKFNLRYAKPIRYETYIAFLVLSTLTHGLFIVITGPINLAVAISVTATGERLFTYNQRTITMAQLRMFARYPQGIPPSVNINSIH